MFLINTGQREILSGTAKSVEGGHVGRPGRLDKFGESCGPKYHYYR